MGYKVYAVRRHKKKVWPQDIEDYAVSELGIKHDELYRMTWADYMRVCIGKAKKDIERMREIRLIASFIVGKVPHQLWTLPGDFDHLTVKTQEERLEMAKKFGVAEKWGLIKN